MWFGIKRTHWILTALIVLFLSFYFGLLSWSRVGDALETLAANPGGAKVFAAKVERSDAIFMIFMILFLTPLAIVAVGGLIVFVTAALAGMFQSFARARGAPFWVFSGFAYLVLVVVGFFTRAYWMPQVQGVASLIARALLAASR
jgi:hypothetical protein